MNIDLEKLRALPSATRTQISFFTALSVAGLITLVWVTTLGGRFEDKPMVAQNEKPAHAVQATAAKDRVWERYAAGFKDQLANIAGAFGSIRIETGREDREEIVMPETGEPDAALPQAPQGISSERSASSSVSGASTTVKNAE